MVSNRLNGVWLLYLLGEDIVRHRFKGLVIQTRVDRCLYVAWTGLVYGAGEVRDGDFGSIAGLRNGIDIGCRYL